MIKNYIKAFRFVEVFILTGFVLIGAIFSISKFDASVIIDLVLIFCVAFCSIVSLYAFNAYQGRAEDVNNPRLTALSEVSSLQYLVFSLVFFGISLIIGFCLEEHLLYLILLLGLLGVGYSIPVLGKGRPFAGTFIHFLFQTTAFHIAYTVFQPYSIASILLSIYFSLLYTAGHLHHEVIDFEADKKTSTKTGAVYLGLKKAERLSFMLFSLSVVYWVILYLTNFITGTELMPFLVAFIIHLYIFNKLQGTFETNPVKRTVYRKVYRLLYFAAGLVLFGYKMYVFY